MVMCGSQGTDGSVQMKGSTDGYLPRQSQQNILLGGLDLEGHRVFICPPPQIYLLPRCSVVKNPPASAGDPDLIPLSGRSPKERNGNPLLYSCLGNPLDRGEW